jgi:hypothetical protein
MTIIYINFYINSMDIIKNLDMKYVLYALFVFIFLKYGLKEMNLIYMIIISFGIVFYVKNFVLFKKKTAEKSNKKGNSSLGDEVDGVLKKIEKYDNNNLMKKIRKNYKNLNKYLKNKNKLSFYEKGDVLFLKEKILNYINSLNVSVDDPIIDNVYTSVSKMIDNKLK